MSCPLVTALVLGTSTLAAAPVSFEREVAPLLERRCNACHHPEESSGGLDLTRVETIHRGGDELGPAIVPGRPADSLLIRVLTGATEPAMPENGEPLPATEIDLLRRWIAEGAKDDTPTFPDEEIVFFEREIRPVLAGRCFKCHAGEDPEHGLRLTSRHGVLVGGRRGPAVVVGKPDESLLIEAVRHEGELEMPLGGDRLSDAQVAAFRRWIERGLAWPSDERVVARERQFTISDADRDHWAFRPLPKSLESWDLDEALRTHQRRARLTTAEPADRHRLLRRVTYDLIGYPPTPEEIAAFVNDASPDAFEKVVDRLLDSPHFGWRWGRHWLDYTRNGSCEQSNRAPAFDADRYANWVARCFNEDRPWDWFVRVHVAGDLMPAFEGGDYSVDQALAAAVPLNGPRTFARIETQTFVLMDKLDEGVEFLGRSILGTSLECARCHDHKFDPISQRDYYALLGFFQSSGHAPIPEDVTSRAEAESHVARHAELVGEQARLAGLIRGASVKINVSGGGRVKAWQRGRVPELAAKQERLVELECAVLRRELALARAAGDTSGIEGTRAALEACEESLRDFQPITFDVRSMKHIGYLLHGHKDQVALIRRVADCGLAELVPELTEQDAFWTKERETWVEVSRFGGYTKDDPAVAELARWDDRHREIAARLTADPRRPFDPPTEGHLYVRCDGGLRREEDLAPFDARAKERRMLFNGDNPNRVLWLPPYVGDARLLRRGDVLEPDELVPRGFPVFFGEERPVLEGSGRLQLAEWLTRPDSLQSALVARTAANRVWQHLFGEAFCRTPKELGRLGETPDMPDVLDGLAARFVDGDWSVKALVRHVVLSDAYRRSATSATTEAAVDPENRYFARQNVRRLEYEAIANTMGWLSSGKRAENPRRRDDVLPAANDYAKHFDAPSKFDLVDRRVASISPSQALFLTNNPAATRRIAAELVRRLGPKPETPLADSVRTLYLTVVHRPPTREEQAFAREHVLADGGSSHAERLSRLAMLLLCGNETFYVE